MAASYNELFGLGSHSVDSTLEGWWKLQDDAANTTATDSSGKSRNISFTANTSSLTTSGPNSWLTKSFSLVSHDGETTDSSLISLPQTHAMTVLSRCKANTLETDKAMWAFRGTDDIVAYPNAAGGVGVGGFRLFWRDVVTVFRESTSDLSGVWGTYAFRATSNTSRSLYRSGSTVATNTSSGTNAGPFSGFVIGNFKDGVQRLNGAIADVAIFSRSLSDAELLDWEAGPEPLNTVAPTLSGTQTEGQTLTSTTGTWDSQSNGTITYSYQWTRSNDGSGSGEADIGGATSSTYTLVAGDVGKFIRCRVRGTNDGGFDAAEDTNSNFTGAIAASLILLFPFGQWIEASETADTVVSVFGQWWDGDTTPPPSGFKPYFVRPPTQILGGR